MVYSLSFIQGMQYGTCFFKVVKIHAPFIQVCWVMQSESKEIKAKGHKRRSCAESEVFERLVD
jgi:hypothetical protein